MRAICSASGSKDWVNVCTGKQRHIDLGRSIHGDRKSDVRVRDLDSVTRVVGRIQIRTGAIGIGPIHCFIGNNLAAVLLEHLVSLERLHNRIAGLRQAEHLRLVIAPRGILAGGVRVTDLIPGLCDVADLEGTHQALADQRIFGWILVVEQ
jgi:hypothetical protein